MWLPNLSKVGETPEVLQVWCTHTRQPASRTSKFALPYPQRHRPNILVINHSSAGYANPISSVWCIHCVVRGHHVKVQDSYLPSPRSRVALRAGQRITNSSAGLCARRHPDRSPPVASSIPRSIRPVQRHSEGALGRGPFD